VKQASAQPVLRPSSPDANRTTQEDLRKLASQFGNRSDDWLHAGDWLAAGEKLKSLSPRYKAR
jgi:hypothetical protein